MIGNTSLYQKILESNLVNFIIMMSILVLIFKKAKFGNFIDKMADDIRNSVMTSSEAAKKAINEYKKKKKSTKNLQAEKNEIITRAKTSALNIEDSAKEKLQIEQKNIDNKCAAQVQNVIEKAKSNTASEILDLVSELAEDEVRKRLDDTMQRRLIQKSINELDKLENLGEIKF